MRFKQTLVMLCLLALAVAAAVFLERRVPTTEEREGVKDRILSVKADDIVEMTFQREGEKPLTVVKDADGGWRLVSPIEYKADGSSCKAAASALEFLKKEGTYPQGGTEFKPEDYGLNAPRLRVSVKAAGGELRTVSIGSEITPGDVMYVGLEGAAGLEKHAYVCPSYALAALNKSVEEMRDKSVLDLGEAEVTKFRITRTGEEAGEAIEAAVKDGAWELASPVADDADAGNIDGLVRMVRYLRAAKFVEDAPEDLSRYGLDSPRLSLTLWQGDDAGAKTLLLGADGKEADQEILYAMRDGLDTVFAVKRSIMAALAVSPSELRLKKLGMIDRANVSRVTIARGDEKTVLEGEGAQWRIVSPELGKADMGVISRIYDAIENAQAESFVDSPESLAAFGLAPPAVSVTVETKDGRARVFSFGYLDGEGRVWCRRDERNGALAVPQSVLDAFPVDALALKDKSVLSFPMADATALELTGPYGTWRVEKEGTSWKALEAPEGAELDAGAANGVLLSLAYLGCERYVELAAADLAPYGLTSPAVTVVVTLADGGKRRVLLGREEAGGVYATVGDSRDVVLLGAGSVGRLLVGLGRLEGEASPPGGLPPGALPPGASEVPPPAPPTPPVPPPGE